MALLLWAQVGQAVAGNVRLYWDANTETDLAGYVLAYGSAPGTYTTSVTLAPSAVTHEFTNLPNGTYYFAVRAFNAANQFSSYSNEVRVFVISAGSRPMSAQWPSSTPSRCLTRSTSPKTLEPSAYLATP